ncbi:MAG TPA: DUF4147 domain-containing protein [Kofleriaceae bacterium]
MTRLLYEEVFREAVAACLPERFVRQRLATVPLNARFVYGLALGNAAISMVRGAGPVMHGLAITRDDDRTRLPKGWAVHTPDASSAIAIMDLVATATADDVILVLLSAGAELILPEELQDRGLAVLAAARLVTLVASDRRSDYHDELCGSPMAPPREIDDYTVVTTNAMFTGAVQAALATRVTQAQTLVPLRGVAPDVTSVAIACVAGWQEHRHPVVDFVGRQCKAPPGRARLLAIALAQLLEGTNGRALVAASSGWDDGPVLPGRPRPAGAFVDGTSWATLRDAPDKLEALHDMGALVITQLTGIDYAGDIVIVG